MKKITLILIMSIIVSLFISILSYNKTYNFWEGTALKISGFLHFTSSKNIVLNEKSIPYLKEHYIRGKKIKSYYNPVRICQYGLKKINNKNFDLKYLKNIGDWIIENTKVVDGIPSLPYYGGHPDYFNAEKTFYSGMANGLCIEYLTKLYEKTKTKKYISHAEFFLKSFNCNENIETCIKTYLDKNIWYLEYKQSGSIKPYTLNGFIFSLLSIKYYYDVTKDEKALKIFNEGIKTLKNTIYKFDNEKEKTTMYDLIGHYANKYHFVHLLQLKDLYKITSDSFFINYYNKWKKYEELNDRKIFRLNLKNNIIFLLQFIIYFIFLILVFKKWKIKTY